MEPIDWDLARFVGNRIASPQPPAKPLPELQELADAFARRVSEYSGLPLPESLPPIEAVDRSGWIEANLQTLKPVLEPLAGRRAFGGRRLAGPANEALRVATSLALGAQVGAVAGLLSQRVLGQYDIALLGEERPPRLLLVAPNITELERVLRVDGEELARWVAIHELTHAVQFGAAGWLRSYLGSRLEELIGRSQLKLDPREALALLRPQGLVSLLGRLRRGELLRIAVGERRWPVLQQVQAAMSLIEGHAEHVMDAVGEELLPSLRKLRAALERRRRERRPPPWRLLEKALGLELKLRQYELGRRFCDGVAKRSGPQRLALAFAAPENLPTPAELERPERWLARVAG